MHALIYTLLPLAACIAGGLLAAATRLGPKLTSTVQHFAAGVIFAAAAGELLPDVLHSRSLLPVLLGATVGLMLMLGLKEWVGRVKGPLAFIATAGIDILIDGIVLGIGFAAGPKQGLLLTIALTVEVLFLGLAVAEPLRESQVSPPRVFLITLGLGLMLPLGTVIGLPAAHAPAFMQTALLSFGLVALLYLVTEELLVEAHEKPDSPWITATFFVGFMLLAVLEQQIG